MKSRLVIFLFLCYCSQMEAQVCISLNSWTLDGDNGDGTCNYTVNVTVDSGNGAQGDAVFSIGGTTVFTVLNCVCNPQVINVPITTACNSTIDLAINYDAPGNGNDCSGSTGSFTLPVIWGNFSVIQNRKSNILQWQTLTEINNDHFVIESSELGHEFKQIGFIDGSGNSYNPKDYEFIDDLNYSSEYIYYRIKQVDYDGKFSYSSIRFVKNLKDDQSISIPNPIQDEIVLEYKNLDKWYLYNFEGVKVLDGSNSIINTSDLMTGIYILVAKTSQGTKTHRLIKP